jgi:hypothetical protein
LDDIIGPSPLWGEDIVQRFGGSKFTGSWHYKVLPKSGIVPKKSDPIDGLSRPELSWRRRRRKAGSPDWFSKETVFCALAEMIQAGRIDRDRMILLMASVR